jgi:hypothetical protein
MRRVGSQLTGFVMRAKLSGATKTSSCRRALVSRGLPPTLPDRRFSQAPRVHSELVNRQKPSSNTQAGVRALMHAMISAADKPALPAQRLPVSRSSAISLASLVTVRTRVAQGPAAPPESRQKATPRQANRLAGR